jgi:hypothetical protein
MVHRWVSLLTVMAGVSLVGYSGSLIKDALPSTLRSFLSDADPSTPEPVGDPEVTKVLVGKHAVTPYRSLH